MKHCVMLKVMLNQSKTVLNYLFSFSGLFLFRIFVITCERRQCRETFTRAIIYILFVFKMDIIKKDKLMSAVMLCLFF